jgi:CHASE2 domain-containing sensor protein/signal transduction histidine kinase
MKATRLLVEWAVLLIAAITGAALLQSSDLTQRLDNQLLDSVSPLARPAMSDDITLVAIDDQSLGEIGAWPWPRAAHGELIDRLNDAGARAIVLDILFLENTNAQDDAALERAMRRGDNVLLPHTFAARINSETGIDRLYPLPEFGSASAGVGHVVAEPDPDGIFRRFDLVLSTDKGAFPHVAKRVLEFLGEDVAAETAQRTALIPFHPAGSVITHSASDILANGALPEFFEGKIVLIGATAQGMGDRYSVAAGDIGVMTGIETQANLLNALMADALINPVSALWQNLTAALALFALFLTFWYLPPRISLYVAIGLVAALLMISASLLAWGHLWMPIAPAIIMIVLSYPLWSWRRLSHVSRYLDKEAARMMGGGDAAVQHRGMEYVARQVERVRGLILTTEGSLTFVRQVIETAPDAMIVLNDQGIVQMLNAKADQLFPDWQSHLELSLVQLFLLGRVNLQRDGDEMLTEDGRIFLIARAPLGRFAGPVDQGPNDSGASGEVLALREITDLRRLDQERKQMLEFLSHDMRTPQVAIIGLTRKPTRAAAGNTMERIKKQAERTLKLADDFVQLARLESPQLQLEDSDISALIEEACDRAYVLAEAKHIRIEQQLPEEPCFGDVDASLIARMLDNLIGNAVKYSPENSRIDVTLNCASGNAKQIIVSDEGAGLPEARIKDPFARFGAHATDAGPSAGLGLALVKKVVDAHDGTIDVASRPGQGTRFTISLAK